MLYNSPDAGYLALWVGQDQGIFQKNGLDVDAEIVSNGTQSMSALLSGQVQFIQTGGSAALSPAADGANLTILSVVVPVYNYLLEAAPSIQSASDLKGESVAVGAIGDSGYLATVVALQHLGLDPANDVTILPIGSTPTRAAALQTGQVQAAVLSFPDNLKLESQGFKRLLDLASMNLPAAGQATIADKGWVDQNKDVTQRYIDAFMEANLLVKRDRSAALASMKKNLPNDTDDELNQTYDYYLKEVFPDVPTPSADLFTDAVSFLGQQSDSKIASLDLSSLLDPSFVQSAVSRGIK